MKELSTYKELENWLYDKTKIGFIANNGYNSELDGIWAIELYSNKKIKNILK